MRHIALKVTDMVRSKKFYQDMLGMEVVWEPDPQNVYLSSGCDNIALHEVVTEFRDGRCGTATGSPGICRRNDRPSGNNWKKPSAPAASKSSTPSRCTATAAPLSTVPIRTGSLSRCSMNPI